MPDEEAVGLLKTIADLQRELAQSRAERDEALAQQTASADILATISSSQTQLKSVFETIVDRTTKLCDATFACAGLFEGEALRFAAISGVSADSEFFRPERLHPPGGCPYVVPLARAKKTAQTPDLRAERGYLERDPFYTTTVDIGGARTALRVPLLKDSTVLGHLWAFRQEVRPFSDRQIALLQNFADQAVIAIENVRLFTELEGRNRDLTEALEQRTATGEILRAIASSPTAIQPVLETLVRAAARFCNAPDVVIMRLDGGVLRGAAGVGTFADLLRLGVGSIDALEIPLTRGSVSGRAVLDRRPVHIHDLAAERENEFPVGRALQRRFGHRTMIATPMLREGAPVGTINLHRMEVNPFSDKQVELLQTFADQAVIAIENTRLFNETKEALEQQSATSDILGVISRSPTDVQPVFDAIARAALRLCNAGSAAVLTFDGKLMRLAALANVSPDEAEAVRLRYPKPPGRETAASRAILAGRTVVVPDVLDDHEFEARARSFRSVVSVPLIREGSPIGAITVGRPEPGQFPEKQIVLLQTFADQAVIAIENARLFNETEEALERQTATSEILRVISQSPRDVQPVFEIIAQSALRLCNASSSNVVTYDGKLVRVAAQGITNPEGAAAIRKLFPRPPDRGIAATRAIVTSDVVAISDVMADAEFSDRANALAGGFRSVLAVPLLRGGKPIGAIAVGRPQPGSFPDKQVSLLRTFADQAVIAIENVRLFTELESRTLDLTRSVGELRALGEIGQAVSSTLDLETVLSTIVSRAAKLAGMDGGSIWEYDETHEEFHLHATDRLPQELVDALKATPIRKGEGALGRLAITGEPVEIRDIADEPTYQSRVRDAILRCGFRSVLTVPLLREDKILGALAVNHKSAGEFPPHVVGLLRTFATQSALAIQNARLYRELESKSRELEAASHHKSEFLANMSHELRTPLNAIIGFSEVLSERMFGDINEKQAEYLADILQSGQHLLALINDILDLSKIEAGRMELELSDLDLPSIIDNTLTLVRERAVRRSITLGRAIDERLGMVRADERKVKQVLLNLLSNALKFTPEGGKIDVRAALNDGVAEISVTDTGIGISPEDQEAVFEEFRQVGTASKKVEGTGLGLAISRKFIELHGGKIWVRSQVGSGSTFAFTLPLQGTSRI